VKSVRLFQNAPRWTVISQRGRLHVSASLLAAAWSLSGCFVQPSSLPGTPSDTSARTPAAAGSSSPGTSAAETSGSSSLPGGARAAKIIFTQSSSSGSFDSAPSTGTINSPGNGHQAKRVFNADGSLLASGGPTASAWPKWLSGVEIGISGASNSGAKSSDCARFTATNESSNSTGCQKDSDRDGTADAGTTPCGAPDGYFRVSEYDCTKSSTLALNGNGGPTDGVYIRANFSRDTSSLGSNENILVTLEYSANFLNSAASDPSTCFQGGVFHPTREGCSDQLWQIFLKHTAYEVVQPYLMLAPAPTHVVDRANGHFGGNPGSKQFILPLSGDASLSVLQISRIQGPKNEETPGAIESSDALSTFCSRGGDPTQAANSAGCVGMVFHSMTFIRM
jgi:hypothetical protein